MRLVVVGGGISGTAAAFTARREAVARGQSLDVLLLEREREVGGKAESVVDGDWLLETGPIGYVGSDPVVDELAEAVGLDETLLTAGAAQSHRFVYSRGRIREAKAHPIGFVRSGLLSFSGLLRAAREPWVPRRNDASDESVWDFAARRLGPEFADRLIHPMVLGVFAGDAKKLSLESAFPIMAELEQDHGSLVRAQIARARARKRGELPPRRSTLCSFEGGIQALPRALAAKGGFTVRTGTAVSSVVRRDDGAFLVATADGESLSADAVVLACEGYRSAEILSESFPAVARELLAIPHPPVAVVGLGYGPEARRKIPEGFGVLIPRGTGYRALGVTWDGYLFPRGNEDGGLLVRVLLGGSFDPEIESVPPEEIERTATREMASLFRLEGPPLFSRVRVWKRAIPQYELGHRERLRAIEAELDGIPGLLLAGNALYGTAFGKAAARGAFCGTRAVESLFERRVNRISRVSR
jgi:oxygen-dependent protoporphyrinogen oxidase